MGPPPQKPPRYEILCTNSYWMFVATSEIPIYMESPGPKVLCLGVARDRHEFSAWAQM